MQKRIFNILLTVLITTILSTSIVKATAIIDETFGTKGTLNINIGTNQTLKDIFVQPDGKILIGGTLTSKNGDTDIFLARYNANGTFDNSFGNNGISNIVLSERDDFINDFEIQADGKIVAVGSQQISENAEIFDFLMVRFNTNGTLDSSFGGNGVVTANHEQSDSFSKLAIQPDGKIVTVGATRENVLRFLAVIARFNTDGTFDTDFRGGGLFFRQLETPGTSGSPNQLQSIPSDVEILPNGRILVGGNTQRANQGGFDQVGFYEMGFLPDGGNDVEFSSIQRNIEFKRLGYSHLSYDAEVLENGEIVRASGIGVNIGDKTFLQNGTNLVVLPNGNIAVSGNTLGGNLKIYSQQNLISKAWNVPTGKLATQLDNQILILGKNTITRVSSFTSQGTRIANFNAESFAFSFNADNKSDFAVYRPSERKTYILRSDSEIIERTTLRNPNKIFPEFTNVLYELNNISHQTLINWENGNSPNEQGFLNFERISDDDFTRSQWGLNGDIPYGGDFNGDGEFDIGVFRPSDGIWYGYRGETIPWGTTGDKPVPADYDFDGITDIAVYRPSTGVWWVRKSSDNQLIAIQFGIESDIPLTGDYDGDGFADFTVYRPSEGNWYQFLSTDGFKVTKFGIETDYPVPGDYDGDGRFDLAVYRDGLWYLLQSSEGFKVLQFGTADDIPISIRYDQ